MYEMKTTKQISDKIGEENYKIFQRLAACRTFIDNFYISLYEWNKNVVVNK